MAQRSTPGSRPVAICLAVLVLGYLLMALAGSLTPRSGLGFSDGNQVVFTATDQPEADDLARAADVVADRASGIGGATVRTSGGDQVIVEYPGPARPELTTTLVEGGRFGIRIVARDEVASAGAGETEDAVVPELADQDYGEPTIWAVNPDADSLAAFAAATCQTPVALDADDPDKPLIACVGMQKYLLSPVVVDTDQLTGAVARASTGVGDWSVRLRFDTSGTRAFTQMSRVLSSTQGLFAVVLDGNVVATARMQGTVSGGEAVLTGNYTEESATALAERLDAGTLPVRFAEDPQSGVATASVDRAEALTLLGVALGGLLLLSLLAPLRLGRVGWALPIGLVFTSALGYPVVALLGEATGLVISPAGVVGLFLAPAVSVLLAWPLLTGVGQGIGAGQSAKVAAHDEVRRSRADAAWATVLPALLTVALLTIGRGTTAEFALGLAVAVVLAAGVHLAFTTSVVQMLAERGGSKGIDRSETSVPGGARTTYLVAGVLSVAGLLGVVLAVLDTNASPPGETSAGWLTLLLVISAVLTALFCHYRFDDLRYGIAGLIAAAFGTLAAVGVPLLLGASLGRAAVAVGAAVLVLCLYSVVGGLSELERVLGARKQGRPAVAGREAVDQQTTRLLPAAVCLGVPLLATVASALALGSPGLLVQIAVVLLLGVMAAAVAPILAGQLVADLPRRGSGSGSAKRSTARIPAGKGAQRNLQQGKRPAAAKQARKGQPGRQSGAKRGKKK